MNSLNIRKFASIAQQTLFQMNKEIQLEQQCFTETMLI